jgi:hypothetical protein
MSRDTQAQLARMVAEAKAQLAACKAFADDNGLSFRWSEEYGSREQTYHGAGSSKRDDWEDSDCSWESSEEVYTLGTWTSSSDKC